MSVSIESKIDFSHTVGTEARFALRNWLQLFIDNLNSKSWETIISCFTHQFRLSGLDSEKLLDSHALVDRWGSLAERDRMIFRFPELSVNSKGFIYQINGRYEEYKESLLVLEGNIELTVMKDERGYKFRTGQLYPRFMVHDLNDESAK